VKACLGFFFGGEKTVEYCCPCIHFYAREYELPTLNINCTSGPPPQPSPSPPTPPPPTPECDTLVGGWKDTGPDHREDRISFAANSDCECRCYTITCATEPWSPVKAVVRENEAGTYEIWAVFLNEQLTGTVLKRENGKRYINWENGFTWDQVGGAPPPPSPPTPPPPSPPTPVDKTCGPTQTGKTVGCCIYDSSLEPTTASECRAFCLKSPECVAWTWNKDWKIPQCFLHASPAKIDGEDDSLDAGECTVVPPPHDAIITRTAPAPPVVAV
jgi:hypothetical protein